MRQELQNIEYIERYLEKSLSSSDHHKFEQHMQEDPGFKKAVDLQRQITEQLKEEAFLTDIADYHKEFLFQENAGIAPNKNYLWYIIPTLLVLSLVTVWWIMPPSEVQDAAPIEQKASLVKEEAIEVIPNESPILSETSEAAIFEQQRKAFEVAFKSKRLHSKEAVTIALKGSKSVLHIPANALVDQAGNPVRGTYELEYREIKERSQMAFNSLPMYYKDADGKDYHFNSVGLIEVRASKNGEALQLAPGKNMRLDYDIKARKKDLKLYQYDEDAQNWTTNDSKIRLQKPGTMEVVGYDSLAYQNAVAAHEQKFGDFIKEKEDAIRQGKKWEVLTTKIWPEDIEKIEEANRPDPSKYVIKHQINPTLVKELRLHSFGVYNCSQKYEIQNQIAIDARYTNKQKEAIENARLLSVIDMNYNAAYSFKPAQFICNSKANNVFLLWTKTGKLYSFVKRAQVELGTGTYSFRMEDVSESIHNSRDLRSYLKFVEKKTQETVTKID